MVYYAGFRLISGLCTETLLDSDTTIVLKTLSNNKFVLHLTELVSGNFEIQRSRTFSSTARDIIVGTMAWTKPSSKVTRFTNGYTTQMSTYTEHNQPLGLLHTSFIRLRIPKAFPLRRTSLRDLVGGSVPDKKRVFHAI